MPWYRCIGEGGPEETLKGALILRGLSPTRVLVTAGTVTKLALHYCAMLAMALEILFRG